MLSAPIASALAVGIAVATLWFIATERIDKVKAVLIGAGLMAVLGLIPGDRVFYSEHEGIDWNVIFLLFGMMVIVGVIKQTGLFDFLAIWAAKRSRGKPFRLMLMLMLVTGIASPVLDNVTIILLVAPVTLVVCNRLQLSPQPYLIAEVLASNIGGAATLIGDPPNIIIGSRAGLTFDDFLIHMTPPVAAIFVLFALFSRVLFRADLRDGDAHLDDVMALQERRAIKDTRLLVRSLAVLAAVIVGFSLHSVLNTAPSVVALVGAGTMVLVTDVDVGEVLHQVEWNTLVFFAGLFTVVAGLVHTGVIGALASSAESAFGDNHLLSATALLFGSSIIGAFVDNIPYTATMTPIVESMVAQVPDAATGQGLWWAFALGACFGGNGTAIAASPNVVAIDIARRAGQPISFWTFTRYGMVVTLLSTALAWVYIWLRYFA